MQIFRGFGGEASPFPPPWLRHWNNISDFLALKLSNAMHLLRLLDNSLSLEADSGGQSYALKADGGGRSLELDRDGQSLALESDNGIQSLALEADGGGRYHALEAIDGGNSLEAKAAGCVETVKTLQRLEWILYLIDFKT